MLHGTDVGCKHCCRGRDRVRKPVSVSLDPHTRPNVPSVLDWENEHGPALCDLPVEDPS